MLNGLDPILIFNFKKLPAFLSNADGTPKIPVLATVMKAVDLPAIPIYLSEELTGILIDTEDKNIDIDTQVDAASNGGDPNTTQRPIGSTIKINMTAKRNSIGAALFAAMADLVFPKVTSKEYSITYLHGAVTVFAGLLHSFSINQNSNNDLYAISLELVKPAAQAKLPIPEVAKSTGAVPLGNG